MVLLVVQCLTDGSYQVLVPTLHPIIGMHWSMRRDLHSYSLVLFEAGRGTFEVRRGYESLLSLRHDFSYCYVLDTLFEATNYATHTPNISQQNSRCLPPGSALCKIFPIVSIIQISS